MINNNFMDNIINNFLNFVHGLSSTEITVLVVITVVLTLYVVYRWFGVYAVAGLFLIYLFAYILYEVDIVNIYKEQGMETERREQILERELMK